MSCGINTQNGAPAGGGGGGILNRAVQVSELSTTPTGTVNTSVCSWVGASQNRGLDALANWVTRADSATLGTLFTILQPGVYFGTFQPVLINAASWIGGVSFNATAAQLLAGTPPDGTDPEFETRSDFISPSGVQSRNHIGPIRVTAADIAGGTNLVRCHATNSSAAPAQGIFSLTACSFMLQQIGSFV